MASDGSDYRCRRAILLYQVPLDHLEGVFRDHVPCSDRKRKAEVVLSAPLDGWQLLGIHESITDWSVYDLAWSILAGTEDEDFNLETLANTVDVPCENLIVVQFVSDQPGLCYYSVYEENEDFDVIFIGRNDEGMELRIDVVEETVTSRQNGTRFQLSVVEYLRSRGVPESYLPGSEGFRFPPVSRHKVRVEAF